MSIPAISTDAVALTPRLVEPARTPVPEDDAVAETAPVAPEEPTRSGERGDRVPPRAWGLDRAREVAQGKRSANAQEVLDRVATAKAEARQLREASRGQRGDRVDAEPQLPEPDPTPADLDVEATPTGTSSVDLFA